MKKTVLMWVNALAILITVILLGLYFFKQMKLFSFICMSAGISQIAEGMLQDIEGNVKPSKGYQILGVILLAGGVISLFV